MKDRETENMHRLFKRTAAALVTVICLVSMGIVAFAAPADKSGDIDMAQVKEWSKAFRGWHYYPEYVIQPEPGISGYENVKMTDVPTVFRIPGEDGWFMSFIGFNGEGYQTFLAQSGDLVHWKNMRLAMGFGPEGDFDHGGVVLGAYLYESYGIKDERLLKKRNGVYWTLYGAYPRQGGYELRPGYEGVAMSTNGRNWTRAQDDPILSIYQEDCGEWEQSCIYQPWLVEHKGRFYNFYNAANEGIEQLGAAFSSDLLNWRRHVNNPVIPHGAGGSYNEKFSSDGKVFLDGDHWVMFFFGVGQGGAHIMAAYSRDLVNWTVDPEPLYKNGGHPNGLDAQYAHKISLVYRKETDTYYMFYNAVGEKGRGIALLTSRPLTE